MFFLRQPGQAPAPQRAAQATAAPQTEAHQPLGPGVEPIELPPLVLTDPLVRELMGRLSSSPTLAVWLATDGLIRAFVVSVENVADGMSPAKHARALGPRSPFRTQSEGGVVTVDPRSYARYDGIANAATSMDPAGLARVYSILKPRLVEAYKELGHPEGDLDVAIERAIFHLLQTPVVEEPIALRPRVLSFRYDRDDLEALSPAQKQLLRMGPRTCGPSRISSGRWPASWASRAAPAPARLNRLLRAAGVLESARPGHPMTRPQLFTLALASGRGRRCTGLLDLEGAPHHAQNSTAADPDVSRDEDR